MTEHDRESEASIDAIAARDQDPPRGRGQGSTRSNGARGRAEDSPPPPRPARRLSVREALADLARIAALPIFPLPWDSVNAALGLGGLVCGYPHILAGGTGKGKTTWILDVSRHHAIHHGPVLVVSLEMSAGHLVARGSAADLGCSTNDLLRGDRVMTPEEVPLPDAIEIVDYLRDLDELDVTIAEMIRQHRRPPLVVIDYLQKLVEAVLAKMERPDPRLATSTVSSALLAIARKHMIPMLVVSSVSRGSGARIRGSGDRAGKTRDPRSFPPEFFDDVAKESGAIEYDAAALFVLHVSDERDVDRYQVATITIAKARFGTPRHVAAAYDGAGGRWHDRGPVERMKAERPGLEIVTAERAAELAALGEAIRKELEAGPKSRNALADALKRRKGDIADAVHPLVRAGVLVERGVGRASKVAIAATVPELPGMGSTPATDAAAE